MWRWCVAAACASFAGLFGGDASAQDAVQTGAPPGDASVAAAEPITAAPRDLARPWLYNDDATIPRQLEVVVTSTNTYSGNDRSTSRAFASDADGPGGKFALGAELGVADMLAVDFAGVLGGFGDSVSGGLAAGARFAPFSGAEHGFRLAVASGYVLDLDRASGMYGRVALSYDFGPARVAATAHGEHVFRTVSDALDVHATAGISAAVVESFRVGAEYIAQDLEEMGEGEDEAPGFAEGGVHHFLGLTASVILLDGSLFVDFGPALALNYAGGPKPVGRVVASYAF